MLKAQVIPAILVKNLPEFKQRVKQCQSNFDLAQIDIADNRFVQNKTYSNLANIQALRTRLNFELHLMVVNPMAWINKSRRLKKIKRIIFHYEAVPQNQIESIIKLIKNAKAQAGLAINPGTPIVKIKPWIDQLDLLLIMGVEPGWSGQQFHSNTYRKIRAARQIAPRLNIGVDGGVNARRSGRLIAAGANILYSGSYLFNSPDIKQAAHKLLTS